jgi:two-component system, OmpR family, sensor histidine kinase MprB
MSFQRRVTIASGAAVAVAVAIASLATYMLVRHDLHRHINRSLQTLATAFVHAEQALPAQRPHRHHHPVASGSAPANAPPYPYSVLLGRFPDRPGDITNIAQVITGSAKVYPALDGQLLPLPKPTVAAIAALARAGAGTRFFDATAHGTQLRVLAAGVSPGYAVVITHSLTEANSTLDELSLILFIMTLGGVALASLFGWFVARTAPGAASHEGRSARRVDAGPRGAHRRAPPR